MGFCRTMPAKFGLFSSFLISTFLAFLIVVSTFSSVRAFPGLWPTTDTWVSALPPAPAALTLELPKTECPDAFSGLKIDREKPLILNPFLLDPPQITDQVSSRSSVNVLEKTLTVYRSSLTTSYSYNSGQSGTEGRYGIDLLLPIDCPGPNTLFFEAHSEFRDLFSGLSDNQDRRIDFGLGTGWRRTWEDVFMFGVSGFFDAARLGSGWEWSPGFGMESVLRVFRSGHFLDMSLNMYRGGGVDLEAGYTLPILDDMLDIRVMAGKYRFFDTDYIIGSKAGVAVSTADRTCTIAYEYGQDSRTPAYHALSCQVAASFQLENLFKGKNPFLKPDPLYPGKRQLINTVAQKVRRDWRHPDSVVARRNTSQGKSWTTPGSFGWEPASEKRAEAEAQENPRDEKRTAAEARKKPKDKKCDGANSWSSSAASYGPEEESCGITKAVVLGVALYAGYTCAFGPFKYDRTKNEK